VSRAAPRLSRMPCDSCLPDALRGAQVGAALAALLALGGDAVTRRGDVVSVQSSCRARVLCLLARAHDDAWASALSGAE